MKDFCSAATTWLDSIKAHATQVGTDAAAAASGGLAKVKQVLVAYGATVKADTDQFVGAVQQLPVPNVTNGAAARAALVDGMNKIDGAVGTFADQLKSLSATDATAFQNALKSAATQLQNASSQLGTEMAQVPSSDLDTAFKNEPTCASLGG